MILPEITEFSPLCRQTAPSAGWIWATRPSASRCPICAARSQPRIHTVRRVKFTTDAAELLAVLTERNIAGIILGLP